MKSTRLVSAMSLLLGCALLSPVSQAADQIGLDVTYDSQTPSIEATLGYPAGSKITAPDAMHQYFQALAKAHPQQVKLNYYGNSWESRPLYYVAISSAENISKLDAFKEGMQQLADPRTTSKAEADQLISSLPASVWLSYGVHGNEISSPEAGMVTAWHLLAADDQQTRDYLDNAIVFIDPLQNPDGRARFVSRYYMTVGIEHSADRISAEHNEPWPSGRSNHYLFDLNRDWIALTQPEIAGQVDALLNYYPLVFVDLHEMGGDTSYYFTPEAEPYNPLITEAQRKALWTIGENNGAWFDERGYDYFTREIFDAFYPGYGASWPLYHGALSMTYEMASARGHKFRTKDGEILTYGDGVQRHFVASMATIETTARERESLLRNFWNYRQQAIAQGKASKERYTIIPGTSDPAGARKLAGLLVQHGVEVQQATESFMVCGSEFPAGSYVVDSAQPAHFMVRTLLDVDVPMADYFIEEQERRRAQNLPDQIYDVTAWSLPLMFNLERKACGTAPAVRYSAVDERLIEPGKVVNPDAKVGFIAAWGDMNSGRLLTAALREGLLVKQSDLPFTHANGERYPAGSLIFTRADNSDGLSSTLQQLALSTGASIEGVDSSWVTDGPNFGSSNVQRVHAPNIALAWDEPLSSLNAGHTRYVIEQQFNYPVTAIRPDRLASSDLSHYQVLIVPATAGDLGAAFGENGNKNIQQWVQRGGVLITLGTATNWAVQHELLSSALEEVAQTKEPGHGDENKVPGMLFESAEEVSHYITPDSAAPYWSSGVLTRMKVDQEHWLSAGVKPEVIALTVGNQIYRPLTIDNGRNIVTYAGEKELLASGYLWSENQTQLAYKPYLMWEPKGKGMVISFAQEPTYRAYLDGLNILLMNAIFGGASHATPLR
ncbi:peptidase M14 [Pseudidiomarina salinarum]|uniref:Peptidase M14 n=1 Tax=Pseudidiomarina salinarum TaxID=435908 RepID=A0A094JHA2_9GAMM|nr:M14 family zinc carboxypeptidase [Pseudidiomarina salinarum]KFZ31931.1 peptidase M14 [Pseudidiomarina salinarum]RUO70293.1 peptidase M14 [Pseudidiomarina salinarum]